MADLKARIFTWDDLSHTDAAFLLDGSIEKTDIQSRLAFVLGLVKDKEDEGDGGRGRGNFLWEKRSLIVLDLFYHLILFARRQNLRTDQLSGLFSIVRSLHAACISSPYDNSSACFKFFTELMVCHSVNRPPCSTALFTMEQVKAITDYVLLTYFKHFKLYKYAFTKRVVLSLKLRYEGEEEEEEEGDKELELPTLTEESEKEVKEEEEEAEVVEREREGTREEREGKAKTNGGDEAEASLTPEQQLLRNLISSSLADHLKQLEVSVEKELSSSDKKIMEKISSLETAVDSKAKGKK